MTALSDDGGAVDAQGALVAAVARYASRELQPRETGAALADVADRVVREAVEAAEPDLPFAVIGMGKLGARELNVASDLDLVFVYDGEGSDDMQRAVGAAERVMRAHPRRGVGARRRPPSGGPQRAAGAFAHRATWSTGSGTPSSGSSSRCCARGTWRATTSSAGASC